MSLQLQYLREKIDTARNLLGVVETMRGLAAVNIRRAEAVAEQTEQYARTLHLSLHGALMHMDIAPGSSPGSGSEPGSGARGHASGQSEEPTLLVISTDMGLCGQFNERIVEYGLGVAARFAAEAGEPESGSAYDRSSSGPRSIPGRWIVVGLRGLERLEAEGARIIGRFDAPGSVEAIPTAVVEAFLAVQRALAEAEGGPLLVVYNRPDAEGIFAGHFVQLFPFERRRWEELPKGEQPWTSMPMTSPTAEAMLPHLVREQVYIDVYEAFVQSFAAENAARLASMKNATDNIDELLEELEARYRRERQDAITTELMELLSGVEAVRAAERNQAAQQTEETVEM